MSFEKDPAHNLVIKALRSMEDTFQFCFTSQSLGEFWNVATRPVERNGFGLSVPEAELGAAEIEKDLLFLPDSDAVHRQWRKLLTLYRIRGVQVHDARLAASMYVHRVEFLLTFNIKDFSRFEGLAILHPAQFASSAC